MIKKELHIIMTGEVLRRLNITKDQLRHLFNSRKLKIEEFQKLSNGNIVYTEEDLDKIKELIFK